MAPHKSGAVDQLKTDQALLNIKPGLVFTGTGQAFKGEVTVVKVKGNDLHVICQQDEGVPWNEIWNLEHTIAGFKRGEYVVVTLAPLASPFDVIEGEQTPRTNTKVDPVKDRELIATFTMFARGLPTCVGLAANQVSYKGKRIRKRFFVLTDGTDWYPILNPKIIKKYGHPIPKVEGCKTWPDKAILAQRYIKLDLQYQDQDGKQYTRHFEGYGAQIIQHEMDHLNGVVEKITDKMISGSVGRNDRCPCGSGKKYKKCCIKHKN